MYHLRKDTIAYHRSRPLMAKNDFRAVPLPVVIKNLNDYEPKAGESCPEQGAVEFYFMNHLFSELMKRDANVPMDKSEADIADLYVRSASLHAQRLFYYILMIITREARHVGNSPTLNDIFKEYGNEFAAFVKGGQNTNEIASVQRLRQQPPTMTVGQYVTGTMDIFNKCSWSSSYGGKKWGHIAKTLLTYLSGETTAEMMVDTAWTLAHNGGPMFNKGVLYSHYDSDLIKILDVQRSGQMPQWVAEGMGYEKASENISLAHSLGMLVMPHVFAPGYIDWFKVEAAGAVHSYPAEQQAQVKKYGKSAKQLEADAKHAQEQAAKAAAMKAAEGKMFHIGPGEFAVLTERKAA